MNQQPDKIFRDKLQSFQTPAPSGAWNRIEANLDKKNDKILWFRIAASLLLVAIAAYLLWPASSINTPKPGVAGKIKTQETTKPEQTKEPLIPVIPFEEKNVAKQEKKNVKRIEKKQKQNPQEQKQENISVDDEVNLSENSITSVDNNNDVRVPETLSAPTETQTTVVASAEPQKLKIIFSADEVDNKYLDKKALAEATSDDKKPSTLKKLLDKAYDLKYNQDPFGDLRQKKDEILALNFRKEKRSEN